MLVMCTMLNVAFKHHLHFKGIDFFQLMTKHWSRKQNGNIYAFRVKL